MRKFILCDLDHTLSDAARRDHLIGGEGGWDTYHTASCGDEPVEDIVHLVMAMKTADFKIIGITARPEKWRGLTNRWLVNHGIMLDELLMRPNDGFRPAPEIKFALAVARFPNLKDEVAFIIDDREDVCATFKALGITTLQCSARAR